MKRLTGPIIKTMIRFCLSKFTCQYICTEYRQQALDNKNCNIRLNGFNKDKPGKDDGHTSYTL